MRRVLAAALLAALPLNAQAEMDNSLYYKRVNLVVADMDRALAIYRDILGYSVNAIGTSSKESYSYPVFKIDPDATIRSATLNAGDRQIRGLALTEVTGMDLPRPRAAPHMTASVIRTEDIDGVFEQIIALGLDVTEPQYVEGDEFDFWERSFVDYDGHLIVLYEIVDEAAD